MADPIRTYELTLVLDPKDLADLMTGKLTIYTTTRSRKQGGPDHLDEGFLTRAFWNGESAEKVAKLLGNVSSVTINGAWKKLGLPTHLHPKYRKRGTDADGIPLAKGVINDH